MAKQTRITQGIFKAIPCFLLMLGFASCAQMPPSQGETPDLSAAATSTSDDARETVMSPAQTPTATVQPTSSFLQPFAHLPAGETASYSNLLTQLSDDGSRSVFISVNLSDSHRTIYFWSAATNEILPRSSDTFTSVSSPVISADGNTIAFIGYEPGTCANKEPQRSCGDIYIYSPPSSPSAEKLSTGSVYPEGPSIALSRDGRFLAFAEPRGEGQEGIFLLDRETDTMTQIVAGDPSDHTSSELGPVGISADGQVVAFAARANGIVAEDTNDAYDVFVYNVQVDAIDRISIPVSGDRSDEPSGRILWGGGEPGEISVSDDGRFISYVSRAPGLTDLSVPGCTTYAGELWATCAHIYVYDRQGSQAELVSMSDTGVPGNRESVHAFMSGDGRWVAFMSLADNLTTGSPPCKRYCPRVYLRDRQDQRTYLVSRGHECEPVKGFVSDLTGDGSLLVMDSAEISGQPEGSNTFIIDLPQLFTQCSSNVP